MAYAIHRIRRSSYTLSDIYVHYAYIADSLINLSKYLFYALVYLVYMCKVCKQIRTQCACFHSISRPFHWCEKKVTIPLQLTNTNLQMCTQRNEAHYLLLYFIYTHRSFYFVFFFFLFPFCIVQIEMTRRFA